MKRLLFIVDPQIDFITGSLPVPGAVQAMNALAEYIATNNGKYVHKIVTADRHPFNHCSFTDNGGEWPKHCVHDTQGAAVWQPLFKPLYTTQGDVTFLFKGENPDIEEYSIFKNPEASKIIQSIVEEKEIQEIDICGLAGDICVLDTLNDGIRIFGKKMFNKLPQFSPTLTSPT